MTVRPEDGGSVTATSGCGPARKAVPYGAEPVGTRGTSSIDAPQKTRGDRFHRMTGGDRRESCTSCSVARALEIVGERWTLLIVRDALYGVRRHNDFLVHLCIPRAVPTARLQTLTTEEASRRAPVPGAAPRDGYVLTERGAMLRPTLRRVRRLGRIRPSHRGKGPARRAFPA